MSETSGRNRLEASSRPHWLRNPPMSGNAFRGVSAEQDVRFGDKEKKLLKSLAKTFPKEYSQKVDLTKVNWEVMKTWIAKRLTELLGGVEDDVLIGYVFEQLEGKKTVDPRILQINLTGFLEKNTSLFCKELWNLLIDAAGSSGGVPQKFLDEKRAELAQREAERQRMQQRLEAERAKQELLRAEHAEASARERDLRRSRGTDRERDRGRDRSRSRERGRRYRSPSRSRSRGRRDLRRRDRDYREYSRSRSRSRSQDRRRRRDRGRRSVSRDRPCSRYDRQRRRSPSYDRYNGKDEYRRKRRSPSPRKSSSPSPSPARKRDDEKREKKDDSEGKTPPPSVDDK